MKTQKIEVKALRELTPDEQKKADGGGIFDLGYKAGKFTAHYLKCRQKIWGPFVW